MIDITIVHGGYFMVYKPTYNWGGPSWNRWTSSWNNEVLGSRGWIFIFWWPQNTGHPILCFCWFMLSHPTFFGQPQVIEKLETWEIWGKYHLQHPGKQVSASFLGIAICCIWHLHHFHRIVDNSSNQLKYLSGPLPVGETLIFQTEPEVPSGKLT